MKLLWESIMLTLICLLDAVSTFWLIENGKATEMNPLMDWVLGYGWEPFFAVKGATVGLAVGFAESYRRYNSHFSICWLRIGIAAYVIVWAGGILLGNLHLF